MNESESIVSRAQRHFASLFVIAGAFLPHVASAAGHDPRAIFAITVNTVDVGESIVILREPASDILVPVDVLNAAGVTDVPGRLEAVDGRDFVSLRSMAPVATFHIDEADSALRIHAASQLFARRSIDLGAQAPPGMTRTRSTSAFLNYAASWSGSGAPVLSGELGLSAGPVLVATTASRSAAGMVQRGLSTLTFDRPRAMTRSSVGDTVIDAGPLWGSAIVAGIGIKRDFSLNPYFVRFPTPRLSETVTTPSTLDVYVNDRLVRQVALAPGTIDLTGIPAPNGPGETRVVIRDAFGRAREAGTTYYVTTSVLARGLHDYEYRFGWRRSSNLNGGLAYGKPLFSASHRVGVTDALTIGARAEGLQGLFSGGPIVTMRLRSLGELELAGSGSRDVNARSGAAISTAWSYAGRKLGFGAAARVFSDSYVSVSEPVPAGITRVELSAMASVPVGRSTTLSLQHHDSRLPVRSDGAIREARRRRLSIGASTRMTPRAQFLWTAARAWGSERSGVELSAGVSISVGAKGTATIAAQQRDERASASVLVQRPLSSSEGAGYRVRADTLGNMGEATLQYQNRYGRYEARQSLANGSTDTTLNLAGGIVAIGRTLQFTRPVEQSYVLVQVPGVEGVRVFSSNLEAGRTDKRGNLLLPALLPNYANRVAIADQDIPFDRAIPEGEKLIAPPWRGGAVIRFSAARRQSATGQIVVLQDDGTRVVPAFGELRVRSAMTSTASLLGRNGEFFFEEFPHGPASASLEYRGSSCLFTIAAPAVRGPLTDLGELSCQESRPAHVASTDEQ